MEKTVNPSTNSTYFFISKHAPPMPRISKNPHKPPLEDLRLAGGDRRLCKSGVFRRGRRGGTVSGALKRRAFFYFLGHVGGGLVREVGRRWGRTPAGTSSCVARRVQRTVDIGEFGREFVDIWTFNVWMMVGRICFFASFKIGHHQHVELVF